MNNSQTKKFRVLLVEDNPGDALVLQATLNESASDQFEIAHVQRLSSAIETLMSSEFDVVLLDLSLPDAEGLDTLRTVLSHAARVPIVMLTGLDDETIATTALREGAQDYLVKGQIDHNLLVRSLRYAIERKRVDEALRESEEKAKRLAEENFALARIGRIISDSLDIENVFEKFADEVKRLIPFDRITINSVNIEDRTFTDIYMIGVEVPTRERHDVTTLDGSLTIEAVRERKGVLIQANDVEQIPSMYPGTRPGIEAGFRSFITVPLISNDKVIGTFHIRSKKPEAYSDSHLALAESVAAQIAGVVANAQLYSEVLKAQQAVKESERRYRQIVEGATDVVYTTDSKGNFTFVNHTATMFTEFSQEELVGKYFTFLVAPEWKGRVKRFYYRQFISGSHETRMEFPIITKSGQSKWIEQNITPQIDGDYIVGYQAIGRDITERRQVEKEREGLISQLQDALAEIKTLTGMIPICSSCKRIRDDKGYWSQLETYISEHSDAELSHGLCPQCIKQLYPGYIDAGTVSIDNE